jgi:hypothetical protein
MSHLTPSILSLASQIQTATKLVQEHLESNALPALSFAADAFPFFPGTGPSTFDRFSPPPESVISARRDILQTCETLIQLMTSPADHLIWYTACS